MDLSKYKPPVQKLATGRATERGMLFDTILGKLNPGRSQAGFAPYTHARLARMLKGMSKSQVYKLIADCGEAERTGFGWGKKFSVEMRRRNQSPSGGLVSTTNGSR